jgi:CTP:phosphocholine cytidylyltransferase-like protein
MLTKKEFDILTLLESSSAAMSQRQISEASKMSVGTVNKLMKDLSGKNYTSGGRITSKGLETLGPYRVKRAVLIAAGFGSRMLPLTLNTPKPLIRVHGKRIIDTVLDAVLSAGISEIFIVRGYLAEQFDQLLYKYPIVRFIENPIYNESNDISSVLCASYLLKNAYVLETDLLISNPKVITKYQYESNYLGIPCERTDGWCFSTDNDHVIREIAIGGVNCYRMFGISYWTEADGAKLVGHIEQVFRSPGGKERYFEHVPLVYYKNDYKVHVRECAPHDIAEIDTLSELKAIDKAYDV